MDNYIKWLSYLKGRDFMIVSDLTAEVEKKALETNSSWHINKLLTKITLENEEFVTTIHVKVLTVGMSGYFNVVKIKHYTGVEI